MIKKILIANRGEIALRIIRSAKEVGIKTVAVYSDADRTMPYVLAADEAVHIGPSPSAQSYLLADKIIEAAKATHADAIHPGYGFLSEQASFAKTVHDAGLIFIGPSAYSIDMMGDKLKAKSAVIDHGVPMVPGTEDAVTSVEQAHEIAKNIGYPILIKAAAGGGGKGMRVVENEEELASQMQLAKSEALNSFSNDEVFIEKFLPSPKHIEIQVLGDSHGNYVYFFDRECSIQRRHQKLVEEAPSSCLTPDLRKEMGECAISVAKACKYVGAGTVEFLVDEQLNYYFLEMNTRLQVEHCVTEMITGKDLVKEQFRVANGEALGYTQNDLKIRGHAIELRICAEDPADNFMPDTGKLLVYRRPQGFGVRVDDGYEEGMDIPIFYDPMIGKVIAWGENRQEAIDRLIRAIDEFKVIGIKTTLPFGKWALQQPAFVEGNYDTGFIEKYFTGDMLYTEEENSFEVASSFAAQVWEKEKQIAQPVQKSNTNNSSSAWKSQKYRL